MAMTVTLFAIEEDSPTLTARPPGTAPSPFKPIPTAIPVVVIGAIPRAIPIPTATPPPTATFTPEQELMNAPVRMPQAMVDA